MGRGLATMGVASSARREGSRVGCGLFDRLNEWLPSTEDVRARGANDCRAPSSARLSARRKEVGEEIGRFLWARSRERGCRSRWGGVAREIDRVGLARDGGE